MGRTQIQDLGPAAAEEPDHGRLQPDKIGSLKEGKLADLLIIDRDYFTIPVDDILKIRPLMVMVGGKMVVLQEALAADFGIPTVGLVYNFRDEDVEHIGWPNERIAERFSSAGSSAPMD